MDAVLYSFVLAGLLGVARGSLAGVLATSYLDDSGNVWSYISGVVGVRQGCCGVPWWSRAALDRPRYMFEKRPYMFARKTPKGVAEAVRGGGAAVRDRSPLGLVSVDVGLHGLALAHWGVDGELSCAWYQPAAEKGRGAEAWRRLVVDVPEELDGCDLLVETMVHYEGSKVRPADLLELQAVCGALVAARRWAAVENVEARTWTDNVPKDVRHARLVKVLEGRGWEDRIERPKAVSRMSDVYDAVGLGLWRFESRSTRAWSWRTS